MLLVVTIFAVGVYSWNPFTGNAIFSRVFSKNRVQQVSLNLNHTPNNYTINNFTRTNFTVYNVFNSNFTIFNFTKSNLTIGNVSNSNIVIKGTKFNITINSRLYRF